MSSDVVAAVDELAGDRTIRVSVVIERAMRSYLGQPDLAVVEVADLELINVTSDQLNLEAADILEYASVSCKEQK